MIHVICPERGNDPAGSGHFGASRLGRNHEGIDYLAPPGAMVLPVVSGIVSKNGYCYGDDLRYRYVEIRSADNYKHRYFYVEPLHDIGAKVDARRTVIGTVQDIADRYPDSGMKNHIHYEIRDVYGHAVNPAQYFRQRLAN